PPTDALMHPRHHLAPPLPPLPRLLLGGVLADLSPDGLGLQVRVGLLDLCGQRGPHRLVGIAGHLMLALHLGQFVFLGAEEARVSMRSPWEGMANTVRPTSRTASRPVGGRGVGSHSQEILTNHLPVALRRIVAVLGVPSSGRCNTILMRPTLDTTKRGS